MVLRLDATTLEYQEFYGKITEQIPELIAEGRVPMSVAGLMQRRLDVRNASDDVKDAWMNNYFDTGDTIIYCPGGNIKIVLDSQHLRDMTPKTKRRSGALVLTPEQYEGMDGEEFRKRKLGKTSDCLSKAEVKDHPIWRILARDQALLNDYVDYIFAEGKKRFGYDNAMGVFKNLTNGNTPEMRTWYVSGLEGRSDVDGRCHLDFGRGRLVGVMQDK